MSPEIINRQPYGRKVDIWSLGCVIIEMATADHPWPRLKSFEDVLNAVNEQKCPPIPDSLSKICKDFIKKCCVYEKRLRMSSEELFKHNFLAN